MKKIYFGKDILQNKGIPFWQPWGCLGCLGRLIGFLLLLLSLLFLLSLFRKCESNNSNNNDNDHPVARVDTAWNSPIANGESIGLPSPEENELPPFDEMEPIPNPDNNGATEIYPNLLYVIFDSDANDETFKIFAKKFSSLYSTPQYKIQYYNTGSKTAILNVPKEDRDNVCLNLPKQISEVDFVVTPVEIMMQYASVTPNDPAFRDANKCWYFKPIQAYDAWGITQGSPDIIVGIVDSYMDLNHPELRGGRCVYPYSIITGTSDVAPVAGTPTDYAGHGTLVTSVAVGNVNNGQGSSGIAPRCKFIPVSFGIYVNTITEIEGLLYCMYHGATVINLSCGANFPESIKKMDIEKQIKFSQMYGTRMEKVWDYVFKLAEKHNTTIVWAAGNENCYSAMDISKRNKNTIRVSAVGRDLKKADFSNFGNFRDKGLYESTISAPGVDIWGALPNNSYDAWPGTSFSAPIITGVVALIKSENKDLTTSQIINILQNTGKPIEGSPEIGNLVQIKDALVLAKKTVASASTGNRSEER